MSIIFKFLSNIPVMHISIYLHIFDLTFFLFSTYDLLMNLTFYLFIRYILMEIDDNEADIATLLNGLNDAVSIVENGFLNVMMN